MMPILLRCLLALGLMLGVTRVAYADDPAERAAHLHFDRGEQLFALGKFDAALDEYQKAFEAKPIPDFLFNIGQCYRNLGDYQQAGFSFKKFLRLEPDAPNKVQVQALIDDLEARQERGDSRHFGLDRPEPAATASGGGEHPIYTKWWFWTGIAVVGIAGGVGIYEAKRGGSPPSTDLGTFAFPK